jgi:hypothetical protein
MKIFFWNNINENDTQEKAKAKKKENSFVPSKIFCFVKRFFLFFLCCKVANYLEVHLFEATKSAGGWHVNQDWIFLRWFQSVF